MAKKKKYYQNKKDRMDESRGMKKSMKKKKMNADHGMIDYNATANLPQEVMINYYKQDDYGRFGEYDDSSVAMEKQANDDRRMAIKSKPKSRY
ncbi:MAG: hypothetical protein R3230_01395 [Nitrosopumilaceae archaeon]|nr:hypothetical protein [Nitrosopumilaceae archaeon]